MKTLFFTSNTLHYYEVDGKRMPKALDDTNGIVDQLKTFVPRDSNFLFVASTPSVPEKVDAFSFLIFEGLKLSGLTFAKCLILDNRTKALAECFVKEADVIFLSGGPTYIENDFFKEIHLAQLLENYSGVIIGQSAGAINMAAHAYNSPEEGEHSEPIYFEGLGLSNINIEPHFRLDTSTFDELQMYQRKHLLEESFKRPIYALCDGAHILEVDGHITVYGEAYLISDGNIIKLCEDKEKMEVYNETTSPNISISL